MLEAWRLTSGLLVVLCGHSTALDQHSAPTVEVHGRRDGGTLPNDHMRRRHGYGACACHAFGELQDIPRDAYNTHDAMRPVRSVVSVSRRSP